MKKWKTYPSLFSACSEMNQGCSDQQKQETFSNEGNEASSFGGYNIGQVLQNSSCNVKSVNSVENSAFLLDLDEYSRDTTDDKTPYSSRPVNSSSDGSIPAKLTCHSRLGNTLESNYKSSPVPPFGRKLAWQNDQVGGECSATERLAVEVSARRYRRQSCHYRKQTYL